jgi:hypothetical protein
MHKYALGLLVAVAGVVMLSGGAYAAEEAPTPLKHKVAAGESLSTIATENNLTSWRPLWNVNTQLQHPDQLNIDEELTVPAATEPTTDRPLPEGYGEPVVAAPVAAAAPAPAAQTAPVQRAVKAAPARVVTGGAPASDLLQRVCQRESGCNYATNTGNGYYGAYQYDIGTWNNYGGYARADQAPPSVQDAKAAETYARRGCSPWPNTCY